MNASDWRTGFPPYLAEAMRASAIKPGELANAIDVHPSTVSMWLKGERRPTLPVAERLATALNLPLTEILERAQRQKERAQVLAREAQGDRDPMADTRRAISRLPMRPAARGALVKLAEELSKTADDDCHARVVQAFEDLATQPYAAAVELTPSEILQTIRAHVLYKVFNDSTGRGPNT